MAEITDLKSRFPLHTIEDVSGIFPVEGSSRRHVEAVRQLVEEIGCCRSFGDQILMTDSDIRDLLDAIRIRGGRKTEPMDHEEGMLVVAGDRLAPRGSIVFMKWARFGGVQAVIDTATEYGSTSADLLDAIPCKYGEFKQHREALAEHQDHGFWYHRKPELVAYIDDLRRHADRNSDELEVHNG